jgi:drug/metabolite transporter (DMT)-like permease
MRIPKGSQFMMLSAFFVALISLGVKLLHQIPAVEVLFLNALGALATSFGTLRYRRIPIWGKNRRLLLARGIAGTLGITLYFFTLQNISLPSAVILHYTAPIFAAIIGIFLVKEPISPRQWLFLALSFVGVILINGFSLTEASWYVLSAIVRKIENMEHPLVVTFYAYLITVPLAGAYMLYGFVMPQARDWIILSAISVLGYISHYYAVKAYQTGPVALVAATAYVAIVYALLFSYVFLGEALPQLKLLGMALVLLGILFNLFYRQKKLPNQQ